MICHLGPTLLKIMFCQDDDIDMLADVKQMAAAAAAAGHASSSFENQLRPIDRYAMRFLDLWDPITDKSAIEFKDSIEEEEWELDRIEKFKDDLEAEIDEDEEPLFFESEYLLSNIYISLSSSSCYARTFSYN